MQRWASLLLAAVGLAACVHASAPPTDFDLIIRGGEVLDGSGAAARTVDVGIRGDRIVALGPLAGRTARRFIEATGLTVAPGFIDVQGQSGLTLLVDGNGESHIRQGITTEIIGEGGSPALWTRHLFEIDPGIRDGLKILHVDFDWQGFSGYLRRLQRSGTSINLGSFISADMVREEVLGFADRAPSAGELARMQQLVERGMQEGGFGLATALIYPPLSYAKTDELVALALTAGRAGGIYISHVRGEGSDGKQAIDEAIQIGERARVPVVVYHLKRSGKRNWGTMAEIGAQIEAARARGVAISACQYPYTGAGTGLTAPLPGWAQEGGPEKLLARLKDPAQRARMRREMEGTDAGLGDVDLGTIQVAWVPPGKDQSVMGKRVTEIAAARHQDPWETYFALLSDNEANVFAFYHSMSEQDVRTGMRYPWVSVGTDAEATSPHGELGRGLVHPRAYGSFPRILGRYVREEHLLELPEAIRKMTSLAADQLGIRERGRLREGYFADLVVFDPRTVIDTATFERPHQFPKGIPYVIVNGVVTVDDGRHTGARAGRPLYGPGYRR
ncbi:MAG TPA: D-aminoacylase [Polyangia bacterium]|nr:D-aminoacylase [Polyangia bacterium]